MEVVKEYINYIKDKKKLSNNTVCILLYRYKKVYRLFKMP